MKFKNRQLDRRKQEAKFYPECVDSLPSAGLHYIVKLPVAEVSLFFAQTRVLCYNLTSPEIDRLE